MGTMYHIKNNGKTLCGKRPAKPDDSITLSAAGRATLNMCCPICKQKYLEEINKFINNIDKWTTSIS